VEIGSSVGEQLRKSRSSSWRMAMSITTVTVEADSDEEAILRAIAEISRALAFMSPFTKIVGARARRQ
jgi:hypothetical protein